MVTPGEVFTPREGVPLPLATLLRRRRGEEAERLCKLLSFLCLGIWASGGPPISGPEPFMPKVPAFTPGLLPLLVSPP